MKLNRDGYINSTQVCKMYKISKKKFNELLLINYIPAITNVSCKDNQCSWEAQFYLKQDIELLLAS